MSAAIEDEEAAAAGGANVTLLVSIFTICFAFFAVLSGMAEPGGEKAQAVAASVRAAFTAPANGQRTVPAALAIGAASLAELGGSLDGVIRLVRVARTEHGDEMRAVAAVDTVFTGDRLRDGAGPLLDRIVAAASAPPIGTRLEIAAEFGLPAGAATDADETAAALRRAAVLAHALVERGADDAAISIGIVAAPEHDLTFRFRWRSTGGRGRGFAGEHG